MNTNPAHEAQSQSNAQYWVTKLGLEAHPEGGYYKETYHSAERIHDSELSVHYEGTRMLSTSIYFLLTGSEVSNFHRLKSDELWYFHAGKSLCVAVIHPNGQLEVLRLGLNLDRGEQPQVLVPKGSIFGSYIDAPSSADDYALVGCMVSPGFDFVDFELFDRKTLCAQYPHHENIITKLTRS